MTYTRLLPYLLHHSLVTITPLEPAKPPYHKSYDPSANCDYHGGVAGHATENCLVLKTKVQGLVESGLLSFKKGNPIIKGNHSPIHGCSSDDIKGIHIDKIVEANEPSKYEIQDPMELEWSNNADGGLKRKKSLFAKDEGTSSQHI